ncbi:MAG: hypothetical protein KGJ23_02355 [Euryarchaeota archaeon]|nr:hypothetical protein [Euryarchaeota archaeon]MDE1835438.1 hypothetical protein [Euryarchaeota archaeon]MDE1879574.1 hypothetical protein [Euryarchaeota archaeon]MDE2046089.1 hypothetical protein [Thermoplasmata archaeon]
MTKDEAGAGPATARLNILELPCPNCGEVLRHRVLHVKGHAKAPAPGTLEGIARCMRCHTSHPFGVSPRVLDRVSVMVSEGPQSLRSHVDLPADRVLDLEGTLRVDGRPVRIARIEGREARNLPRARPRDIVALWTVPTDELHLRLSVVEGARTRPLHLLVPGRHELRVGDVLEVEGENIEITGLRGRGRTFHDPGAMLPAREVQRIYGRTARTPPGGKRAWSRSRETPRS